MKSGSWEDFKERYRKEGKSSEWTLERIREAYEEVAKDRQFGGRARFSCGGSLRQSMEWEESPCRISAHIATVFLWRTTFGWYRRDTETATTERRSTAAGGVRCVEAKTNGERPTEYWWCSSVPMPTRRHKGHVTI